MIRMDKDIVITTIINLYYIIVVYSLYGVHRWIQSFLKCFKNIQLFQEEKKN